MLIFLEPLIVFTLILDMSNLAVWPSVSFRWNIHPGIFSNTNLYLRLLAFCIKVLSSSIFINTLSVGVVSDGPFIDSVLRTLYTYLILVVIQRARSKQICFSYLSFSPDISRAPFVRYGFGYNPISSTSWHDVLMCGMPPMERVGAWGIWV